MENWLIDQKHIQYKNSKINLRKTPCNSLMHFKKKLQRNINSLESRLINWSGSNSYDDMLKTGTDRACYNIHFPGSWKMSISHMVKEKGTATKRPDHLHTT